MGEAQRLAGEVRPRPMEKQCLTHKHHTLLLFRLNSSISTLNRNAVQYGPIFPISEPHRLNMLKGPIT